MSQTENHFLDSKTLIALCFLALSWLAWDYYMKKKYPAHFSAQKQEEQLKDLTTKSPELKKPALKEEKSFKKAPEELFWFEGEHWAFAFSSYGFGIKKVKIKSYKDRQDQVIEFEDPEKALFALQGPETFEPLIFQIQPEKSTKGPPRWLGTFSSSDLEIKKTVEMEEKHFILKVKMEIIAKKPLDFLDVVFSQPLPPESQIKGLFKLFFIYGMNSLKAFVLYEGKQTQRLSSKKLCDKGLSCPSYPNSQVLALGDKYFGKAFLNQSDLLPHSFLHKEKGWAQGRIRYQFLHSKKQEIEYQLFLGPKSLKNLEHAGGGLRAWLDFGFFSWLARPLLLLLVWLNAFLGNWGLAVIALTLIIRLLLLPINIKSYQSMKAIQKLQPELKKIKEQYSSDPKTMNQESLKLMKKHKANPLGGCLPMFAQLPVFFALYRVLGESIELYQSPFFFWIKDMSLKDPYYVFPILSGLVLFLQQHISPTNLPKAQARLIKLMPLVFSVFMLGLPSGLTIYIFVSSLFGLVQQSFFVKLHMKKEE